MIRATNDDMGDDAGVRVSVDENVLHNEREAAGQFALNYNNHRTSDVSRSELDFGFIFLFRYLKVDTVFCCNPRGHDEENPDSDVFVSIRCIRDGIHCRHDRQPYS